MTSQKEEMICSNFKQHLPITSWMMLDAIKNENSFFMHILSPIKIKEAFL
jgi:hypothetical protein